MGKMISTSKAARAALLALVLVSVSGAGAARARPLPGPPPTPTWPSATLVSEMRGMLGQFYAQRASEGSPTRELAPRTEAEKPLAAKDPDTLWEYHAGLDTACHDALSHVDFVDCTGARIAATFGIGDYPGGLNIFEPGWGYYMNDAYARIAMYYAMYHAFAHDFDAVIPAGSGFTPANARDSQDYHQAMVRAYEAHTRDIILRMFRDTRDDADFQTSLTRTAGFVELLYLPVVEFMEEHQVWSANRDRRNAFAIINAMNQRIWWEWVWTQTNGPATAGFVNLGSQASYDVDRPANGILDGTDYFRYEFDDGSEDIPSLRDISHDNPSEGGIDGFWFDSDYPTPGEWWCFGTHGMVANDALDKCLQQVARAGQPGSLSAPGPFSPFAQFYGDIGMADPCDGRAYSDTGVSCGDTNLGSIAEEWLWTFVGLRGGLHVIETLSARADPDLPARALGSSSQLFPIGLSPSQSAYHHVGDRLGYGVAGFHGGAGLNDDLEWTWGADGSVRAIRTLSAASHDGEAQNGRFSVGENDVPPGANPSDRDGDTWGSPGIGHQEYPGSMENHSPGPSSLYGTAVLGLVLGDKPGDRSSSASGLSDSLFDATHRNHVEEFRNWLWLGVASYHRCPPLAPLDPPDDPSCLAPASARRQALYREPDAGSASLRFDYLWRSTGLADESLIDAGFIAESETSCTGRAGVPWRAIHDRDLNADGTYVYDEAGFGAYNELLQGLGGFLRLIGERYALGAGDPDYLVERADLLKPWYDKAHTTVEGIIGLYRNSYGYVPDIENSTCMGTNPDPGDPTPSMISWQQGTGDSVEATVVRRAMWYSIGSVWHWWYDADWLDIDPASW